MPRGPDLSQKEVAMVHSKIKQFWDYDKARIIDGGIKEIRKSCKASGVPISERTVKRIAAEMKAQELASDQIFEETGEVAGLDFTSNRVGKCGRLSQLTDAVKEVYREIININDLGFFHSLKTRVRQKSSPYDSREEMMANVLKTFEEYPAETLDGIWGCYFNNLRSIMACDGGNDYKQAHNGGKKRQKSTGSAVDLSVNVDDYDRCKRLCNR